MPNLTGMLTCEVGKAERYHSGAGAKEGYRADALIVIPRTGLG